MAKSVESMFQTSGNNRVVRLFETSLLDFKWSLTKEKPWLVVVYDENVDKYLPSFDLETHKYWDKIAYDELDKNAPAPTDIDKRDVKKPEKIIEARRLIQQANKNLFWFDTFEEAQDKYIELAKSECNIIVKKLSIGGD